MQLPMMTAAQGDRELIAHLEANCPRLCKPQVMGIGRLPATDEAGLRGNEFQVRLVTQSFVFSDRELALVDSGSGQLTLGGSQGDLILP